VGPRAGDAGRPGHPRRDPHDALAGAVTTRTPQQYYADHGLVSYHEAGHCLVAARLGWELKGGRIGYGRDEGSPTMARPYTDPWERLCVLVAGEMAERVSVSWNDRLANLSAGDDQRGIRDALAELGWPDA